jgi:UDP-N-acetylmuramoylalanine--D-glutamate ligase
VTPGRALLIGFAVTNQAVARALLARGAEVVATDDHPTAATRAAAESAGVELIEAPDDARLGALVASVDAVVPSPLVPERHPVFALAARAGVPVLSEFDLARAWDERPLVAITGTDGKTTVTTLVTEMFEASGVRAAAVGNTEVPLVEAIDDPDVEVFVVEASSFRLGHTRRFSPRVATWLNFAPDHLDVHGSLASYEAAKARIWAHLPPAATAVANADDPVVMRHLPDGVDTVTFGLGSGPDAADVHPVGDDLVTADGRLLVRIDELHGTLPHDVANALAASATALAGGASLDGVRRALRSFRGLPHRVAAVGEWHGVRWYDDSKATAPHATLAALRGFESVVLIAGGRNKGLDLTVLAAEADRIRAVVAIGEAATEVEAAFAGDGPVVTVTTGMEDAVAVADDLARPGDVVLLSPACASFDWFGSYHERGEAFTSAVLARFAQGGPTS